MHLPVLVAVYDYCNRLHAWWSTQSQLATLLSSLIARWWVGLQAIRWFSLKDLSFDKMVGPDALAVVRPTGNYPLDLFCFGIQFYVLLSPYICFISFLYFDLYVFGHDALIS